MNESELRSKLGKIDEDIAKLQATCDGRLPSPEEECELKEAAAEGNRIMELLKLERGLGELRSFASGSQSPPLKPEMNSTAPAADPKTELGRDIQAIAQASGYRFPPAVRQQIASRGIEQRVITGMSETIGSQGGFLLQPTYAAEFLTKTYGASVLASRATRFQIGEGSNTLIFNAIAETSRVSGSRLGGVTFVHLPEGGTKTASMPALRQIKLETHKVAGLCWLTDELLQDATAAGTLVDWAFREELRYTIDNDIYNGTGAGQALGILASPCLVTVPKETSQTTATVIYQNIVRMWSRMWARSWPNAIWVCNQDVLPQLYSMGLVVGTGGAPAYMPANGISGSPYGTLMGRPVIPIEMCPTLGAVGDIALIDMSQYVLVDKGGPAVGESIHVHFTTDETCLRMVYRFDGQPMWQSALTPASGSANTLSPFVVLAVRP
jgi:HK97 family phage major capsid protein